MDSLTFGQKLKKELLERIAKKPEYKRAELMGMLCFCDVCSRSSIVLSGENEGVAAVFSELLSDVFGILPNLSITKKKDKPTVCRADITDTSDILDIFAEFFVDEDDLMAAALDFSREETAFFLCGAYLVCGTMSDPYKSYQMEFIVDSEKYAEELCKIINSCGVNAAVSARRRRYVVYIKYSEGIEDLMTFMGAKLSALELMDITIYKEIRNKTNRRFNCETANIDKTVAASAAQVADIELIIQKSGIQSLPESLREIALLRLENPDMSLSELGKKLSVPLSRSGVNHRFEKLKEIADKYK